MHHSAGLPEAPDHQIGERRAGGVPGEQPFAVEFVQPHGARPGCEDHRDELEQRVRLATGIGFSDCDPQTWARQCCIPTYVYQVRDDVLTVPADVQTIFDNLPIDDKQLIWIENSTIRWDGYLEFQRRPQPLLDWFACHL